MVTSIAPDVWVHATPLRFLGLEVGARMSVVRLPSGDVLVHSPVKLDAELARAIDALGPVRHVIAPNLYHHLFAGEMAERYPEARLYAPHGLAKKRPELRIDAELDADTSWEGAVHAVPIRGSLLRETALVHGPSQTLLSADLLENFESSDHWPTRMYLKVCGIHGRAAVSRPLRWAFRDKKKGRRSLDQLLEHPIERIVVGHGDNIEHDGHAVLREAYAWLS